jgi:hypothetical protein
MAYCPGEHPFRRQRCAAHSRYRPKPHVGEWSRHRAGMESVLPDGVGTAAESRHSVRDGIGTASERNRHRAEGECAAAAETGADTR